MRGLLVFTGAVCLMVATSRASFVLLDPEEYRDEFVEGWPGPYANGTGAGEVRLPTRFSSRCDE